MNKNTTAELFAQAAAGDAVASGKLLDMGLTTYEEAADAGWAAPASDFAGWTNKWARNLQAGDRSTGKSRVVSIEVHQDGSASVKWNNSPRVHEYDAAKIVAVRNA